MNASQYYRMRTKQSSDVLESQDLRNAAIDFLRSIMHDPQAPWSERRHAAIAILRHSTNALGSKGDSKPSSRPTVAAPDGAAPAASRGADDTNQKPGAANVENPQARDVRSGSDSAMPPKRWQPDSSGFCAGFPVEFGPRSQLLEVVAGLDTRLNRSSCLTEARNSRGSHRRPQFAPS